MTPGDPSQPLPCDEALHGLHALRAEFVESMGGFLGNVDRRIASLEHCRERCPVGNRATGETT